MKKRGAILKQATERILDLGIGKGGEYLNKFNARIIGEDLDINQLEDIRNNVSPVVADAYNLPFLNNTFDRIVMLFPAETLSTRQSKRKGLYIIFDPLLGDPEAITRVMKPDSQLEIYTGQTSARGIYNKISEDDRLRVTEFEALTEEEVKGLGTEWSEKFHLPCYKITAEKNREKH